MMRRLAFVALVLVFSAPVIAAPDYGGQVEQAILAPQNRTPQSLTFKVIGEAVSTPDIAVLHFTVVGDGETIAKSQEMLKKSEASVTAALEKQGIKKSQIVAERFGVNPLQAAVGYSGATAAQPLGFRVQKDYSVTIPINADTIDDLLKLADIALQNGARLPAKPTSSGDSYDYSDRNKSVLLEFTVTDPDKLLRNALDDGLAKARKLAEQPAEQMGKGPHALKLTWVQVNDQANYSGRYAAGSRASVSVTSWQPIRVQLLVEAGFTTE